ncbi:MAG: hypothetical protein JO215_02875 [Ktedonobacteraceae bacterium]|nr:hypothetical protein [Ktedonobacteraceae bacterium]
MTEYTNFRQRLDAVLRTMDVQQVQQFLIDKKQWNVHALPADPEFSMYMMIAGSSALNDLHEQAYIWLVSHGHEAEAQAVLGRGKKQEARTGKGDQRSHRNAKSGSSGSHSRDQKRKSPPQRRGGPH